MSFVEFRNKLNALLEPIIKKEGAFSLDHLTHAGNCLELASENAKKIKALLVETEKTHLLIERKPLEAEKNLFELKYLGELTERGKGKLAKIKELLELGENK